jgi:cellulose synthase/poly-beta-1,6-N-acetylglucosamine synthase-like glycosyltransferase
MDAIIFLQYLVFFCWICFSVFVVIGIVGQIYRPKRGEKKAENVEYVLVSVANHKVERTLFECIAHTKEKLNNHLRVLVDEGSELIPELKENSLVIVPASYRRDLVGKGRAINYFIEKEVQPDKWYTFIDDDNLILDDTFLYEIPYYEKKGYVATNPLLVPRNGRRKLTYIMDFIRYFDDLMVFRFFTGFLKRPLIGLHGEFLTVKGGVLKEIGFGNHSLTEDFRFAAELVRRGYKTWQSASKVSIKPPNSLDDLLKQRGRWFKGISKDWRYCPPLMKATVGSRLLIWVLGI